MPEPTDPSDKPKPRVPMPPRPGAGASAGGPTPPRPRTVASSLDDPAKAAAWAKESARRQQLIAGFLRDPAGDPRYQDRSMMITILTEERTYQGSLARKHQAALRKLPPPADAMGLTPEQAAGMPEYDNLEPRRAAMEQQAREAARREAELAELLKARFGVS